MANEDKNLKKTEPENTACTSESSETSASDTGRYLACTDTQEKHVDYQKHPGSLRETEFEYGTSPQDRLYTIEDYYALPDERRVELIDGVFYDMAAPSVLHQLILVHLVNQFSTCAQQHDLPCTVLMAPCDVRLDQDDYTMVQPDLLVICRDLDYLHLKRLEGAPDLAVEILSPSTRSRDLFLKLNKYKNAGVREYWIVDPDTQSVTVHHLEDAENYAPKNYTFEDRIPVEISGGKCSVDFALITRQILS